MAHGSPAHIAWWKSTAEEIEEMLFLSFLQFPPLLEFIFELWY